MLDACLDLFPTDLFKLSQVKAAFNAVGIGPDIYVRDNLADTGVEPYPGGYLWASPDIINRTAPSANPVADFADLSNDSLWENVEFGQDNFVYVRLQNRGPESGDATVNVFFSAATTFGTPGVVDPRRNRHRGRRSHRGRRASRPAHVPVSEHSGSRGHYCMIAVVSEHVSILPRTTR